MSARDGNRHLARHDFCLQRLNLPMDTFGNQLLVLVIVHESDALFLQSQCLEASRKISAGAGLNNVEYRPVDIFQHARQDAAGRLRALIDVHADRQTIHLPCRPEEARARFAGGMINDVRSVLIHARRDPVTFLRIPEGLSGDAGIL